MPAKIVKHEINRFIDDTTLEVPAIKSACGAGKTYSWNDFLFGISILNVLEFSIFEQVVSTGYIGENRVNLISKIVVFCPNSIPTPLCGKSFKALHTHLVRAHEVAVDDYRERYGLPWRRGLCGAGTSEKISKNMLIRREAGFRPSIEVAQKASVAAAKRRPDQPFLVKAKTESLKPIIETLRK